VLSLLHMLTEQCTGTMSSNDLNLASKAHRSAGCTPHAPPVSLKVRDLNIIRAPQRTSSLKSSPSGHSIVKKPARVVEARHNKLSRNADYHHLPFPGSLLKVSKTRRNVEGVVSQKEKENIAGRSQDASVLSLTSDDLYQKYSVRNLDFGRSQARNVRADTQSLTASTSTDIEVGSESSSITYPSTSFSSSSTTYAHRQPHDRRESVRRAVTKAFSTLNRKKRNDRSEQAKDPQEIETGGLLSISACSTSSFGDESVHGGAHDSGIDMVSDQLSLLTMDHPEDSLGSQTTPCTSSGAAASTRETRSPQNGSLGSLSRPEYYGEDSDSSLSPPVWNNRLLAQVSERRLKGHSRCMPSTLRLRLTAKAELKEANLTSEDALWAVIQIHGEVSPIPAFESDINTGIAVAIILDNSRLSTQKDIEKAILEIFDLAERLQEHIDRLGVFCTSFSDSAQDEIPDCCVFHPLQPLVVDGLASQLKKVAKRSQHGRHLETALSQAAQALKELDGAPIPKIRRDIIVMSPNPVGLATYAEMLDASFNVHLLNPGLVPFGILDPFSTYGPRVQNAPRNFQQIEMATDDPDSSTAADVACIGWVIDATKCISQDCSNHRSHSLRDVVVHSKLQANAGTITNISILIHPGADVSTIEQIMGKLEYTTLLPGQMISIPIKVRLKSLASRIAFGSTPQQPGSPRRSVSEAISELELTLGEHLSDLFSIQVRYSHSLVPENTRLVAQESCWLRRVLAPRKARSDNSRVQSVFESVVQNQLALCLAGSGPPADALVALEAEFGSKPVPIYCSKFVDAVKRRLRHRIDQTSFTMSPGFVSGMHSYEVDLQIFVDERKRQEFATDDSPATVVRRRIRHVPENELQDTARIIWQHIRKSSKPEREICDEAERGNGATPESDAHMEEIQKMALRNRRKMSTDTLRSLARDYKHFSRELGGVGEDVDDVD
jgi:hypothetical protein